MQDNILWKKSAKEILSLLKDNSVSPVEALNSIIERIKETHKDINAIVTLCEERARESIKNINTDLKNFPGFLYGLPIVIKDLTEVDKVRTTYGSKIFKDNISNHSDYLVEKIEKMGGVVIGKTNTPEFGAGSQTFNEVFGATPTPWNINYTAGGSSGGTAAALATGAAWLGTGSDLGGSLRNPASFCGVVGLRPTIGTVAHGPQDLPFNDLSVDGPMARNVEDLAILLNTMSGFDPRDPLSVEKAEKNFEESILQEKTNLNIGITDDYGLLSCHPEVREAINTAEKALINMGHKVSRTCPDLSNAEETFQILRAHLFATGKKALYEANKENLKEDLKLNIERGFNLSLNEIMNAQLQRGKIIDNTNNFFKDFDILVAPSSMVPPFNIKEYWPKKVENSSFDNYVGWLMTAAIISLTGCPALAVPCTTNDAGLPIGIQIIGNRHNENLILNLGHYFQKFTKNYNITPINPIK